MGSLVLLTAGGLYPNQPCHALLPILQWALAWIDIENNDDDIMTMTMMTMMTMMIRRTMTEGDDCGSSQRVWPDKWSRWSISRLQSPNIGTSELIRWLKWVGGWWWWWWVMVWDLTQKLVYVCFWQISNIDRIYIYIGHWPTEAMLARNFGLGRYLQLCCKSKVCPYLRIFQGVALA